MNFACSHPLVQFASTRAKFSAEASSGAMGEALVCAQCYEAGGMGGRVVHEAGGMGGRVVHAYILGLYDTVLTCNNVPH